MASIILKTDLGYSTAIEACGATGATTELFHDGTLSVGTQLFTTSGLEIETQFDGQDRWWQLGDDSIALEINTNGEVTSIEICVAPTPTPTATEIEPTPTATEVVTPTPTEIEPTPTATEVTPTPTPVPDPTATPTPTATATPTPTPTATSDNPPTAIGATYSVSWGGTVIITLSGSDDFDTNNLTYNIVTPPTRGTYTIVGNIVTYIHTATQIGSDSFTFTVTDTANQTSAPATITINPENSAPVITTTSTSVLQNTTSTFIVNATDADGDTVSFTQITTTPNGTISFVPNDATSIKVTYTPNAGYFGTDSWIIKAIDSKGAESAPTTINITVEYSPIFSFNISSFGSDPSAMCIAPTPTIGYGSTAQANNVSQLSDGDSIFYDQTLLNKFTPPNATDVYITVSDDNDTSVLKINNSGQIVTNGIIPCTSSVNSSSTTVLYATNTITHCAEDYQEITLWYEGTSQKTLAQLVADNTPLFISKYYSDLYTSTGGTSTIGLIDSGIYSETPAGLYYKRSLVNDWGLTSNGTLEWFCEEDIINITYSLEGVKKSTLSDPTINEFCNGVAIGTTLWYVRPDGVAPFTDLLGLAQSNTPIYKTELGATNEDQVDLFESNVFNEVSGYLVWENPGDGANLKWYGYDSNGLTVSGSNIVSRGQCSTYIKPNITNNTISRPEPGVNDVNVFYGFYSLNPEIEGPEASNNTETLFWPIYVIDGLHTDVSSGADSYIKTFIDTLSFGNVIKTSGFDSCLEYSVKIIAEDIDDAVTLLKDSGITSQQRPVVSTGVEIGLSSEVQVDVYESTASSSCVIGDNSKITTTYTFPFVEGYETVSAGPNFKTETNYKLDNVAKPLLRTNPKLSGNVKLVTSSDGSVYMESISASKDLAGIKYKKSPINPNGNYSTDVANFFKKNGTTSDLVYLTKRSESDLTVLDSYNKQIEEEYQYGTTYNYSKNYDESYRMFAPIWADNNMPKNFVIFKVKNPGGVDASGVTLDNANRIQEILRNSEIIKTFDLSKKSNLGKYIRSHVQQETFPKSPITVSFGKNETTNYNGIDLSSGELTSKGEYIYKDFIETDKALIEANDFITDGFRRNNILCANLLNLEFLFDDNDSSDYSINRYFGLYVDDIDSGFGEISSISNNIVKFTEVTSLVNPNKPTTAIPTHKQMSTTPTLGYVLINGVYYKISNSGLYDSLNLEVKIDDSTGNIPSTIGLSHTGKSVDLIKNDERGYDFVKMSIVDVPESNDKIAVVASREESYKFTFIKQTAGELINIQLEDSQGTHSLFDNSLLLGSTLEGTAGNIESAISDPDKIEIYRKTNTIGNYHISFDYQSQSIVLTEVETNLGDLNMVVTGAVSSIIRVDQIQTNINIQNRTYSANYTLPKGTYSGKFFSNQGTLGDIAAALAGVIHADNSPLDAYNIGSDLWVKARVPGYRLLQHAVLVNKENVIDFIDVDNIDFNNILKLRKGVGYILSKWDAHYLNGGNSTSKSVYINNTTLSEISVGDYLETKYDGIFNEVIDIVEDISVPNSTRSKLILSLKSDIKDGEARVFSENIVKIGLFSAYNIYDMNFDFYDTANSDLKELDYETRANIAYEPYENTILNIDPITGEYNTTLSANDIFSDNYPLEPVNYFSNLSGILSEESVDDISAEIITSEFDRLKENQLKEFATNSRVVPNINKWVLKDSLTVRDQPYYLNTNEAFGRTNFSPDLSATERSKDDMTHEWFYMEKKPSYLRYDELNNTFSYINFIEDFELTPNLFKSTKNNYFDKFMITEGFEKNLNGDDIQSIYDTFGEYNRGYLNPDDINNTFFKTDLKKKYTLIDGGDTDAFASTIFKGLKVVLKNRKEFTNKTALDFVKSSEFNGYKFSILLKTNNDVTNNDVEFEVIQNKKFKFVIFFITLNLGDYWIKGNMNRKLLYELKHKIIYDHTIEDYTYANTPFDGALSWNTADFSEGSPYTIEGINHFDGSVPDFENQIALGENGLYGDVLMDLYPTTPGNTIYKFKVYSIENSSTIKVVGPPVNVNDPNDVLDVAYLPNNIQRRIKYSYVDGGTNIHETVLNKISINSVADMVNLNDDSITYTTIEEDGTINNNRFTINFEDGTEIVKYATLSVEEDNDKPKSYKLFKGIIGYNLTREDDASYYPFLIRHAGAYTVDFRPVVTFTDMYTHFKSNRIQASADQREVGFESVLYKHSLTNGYELTTAKSYYERYNRCGTTFNIGFIQDGGTHDGGWGLIKNHFYHKINETNPTGITKLSESSDKLPLYPLIDEIAISKKDVNVFRSSWDFGYYTRSLSGGKSEDVPGTVDNTEERSYLASTAMRVKNEYNLFSFNYQTIESKEELDEILKNSTNDAEVLMFEDENEIIADFYVTDIATRILSADGVLNAIKQYVNAQNSAGDKTTLNDDANFYINKNIISQFVVDSIQLYTKRFKGSASSIVNTVDINLIGDGGFSPDNNFTYKSHKQKPMNFRLIYNKRLGYSYDIKPMIKIKS